MGRATIWTAHCDDIEDPRLTPLLEAALQEFTRVYPELAGVHRGKLLPSARFILAGRVTGALGCCAVQRSDTDDSGAAFELKRLYVMPSARNTGVADALMAQAEATARLLGAERLILETGDRYLGAIACFERNGYTPTAPYPPYLDDPFARCYEKSLLQPPVKGNGQW